MESTITYESALADDCIEAVEALAQVLDTIPRGYDSPGANRAQDNVRESMYLLGRDAWMHRMDAFLRAVADAEILEGCGPYEDDASHHCLSYGERTLGYGDYCWTLDGFRLHLTICLRDADARILADAFEGTGLIDGWGGDLGDWEDVHSGYGYISVRTIPAKHPNVY